MADKKADKGGKKSAHPQTGKKDFFAVSKEGKLERKKRHCPKCGPGVFLADHSDRASCGKCGYTEFRKK